MRPGDDLTPELREALRHIPQTLGGPRLDEEEIDELVRLGYVEQKLGGLKRTKSGDEAIRSDRR